MLSGQTRDRAITFFVVAVTKHAGGHAFGRNAFSEYPLAGGYFWRSAGLAGNLGLESIVSGDTIAIKPRWSSV